MKAALYTLGCKVNQFESSAIGRALEQRGYELVDFKEKADVYIINTCTVTAMGDKKSRQAARQARRGNPGAVVAVCGCFPQVSPGQAGRLDADVVCGTGNRMELVALVEQAVKRAAKRAARDKKRTVVIRDTGKDFETLSSGSVPGRTRALLKIQDGCQNYCAYCIIPYARGPVRSLPMGQVKREAARLGAQGYREIVLTGIEISSYGLDLADKPTLIDAVGAVCEAAPKARVRLGSLEPRTVDAAFCESLRRHENLCPHFHLSLQSGCDATLSRMGRKYDTARYAQSVALLRAAFPGCAITTDLIVGFPGESEEEFSSTMDFIRSCSFSAMHIFPYSRRTGTRAAAMPGQVTRVGKARRAKIAADTAQEMARQYRQGMVGSVQEVLFETEKEGLFTGHAPNYCDVYAPGTDLRGQVKPVKITGLREDGVAGEIVE